MKLIDAKRISDDVQNKVAELNASIQGAYNLGVVVDIDVRTHFKIESRESLIMLYAYVNIDPTKLED